MKKLLLLLSLVMIFGCSNSDEKLLLGFEIGDSSKEWHERLDKLHEDSTIVGNEYIFEFDKVQYTANIDLNDLPNFTNDLSDEVLIRMNVSINNIAPVIFQQFLEKNFRFNAKKIIESKNKLIEEHNKSANKYKQEHEKPTGIRGYSKWPKETVILKYIPDSIDLITDWREISDLRPYYGSEYNKIYDCTWKYDNKLFRASYSMHQWSESSYCQLLIQNDNQERLLSQMKERKMNSYTLLDYLDIYDITDEKYIDINTYSFRIEFFPAFGRLGTGFDERTIEKVKYNLVFLDDFKDTIYTMKNQKHNLPGLSSGMVTTPYSGIYSIDLQKSIFDQSVDYSKIRLKIIPVSIILSDGSVIKK